MPTPNRVKLCPPRPGLKGEICIDGVCFQWPDPSIGFKPQTQGWRIPQFPCVMLGGNWGRQLVYEAASQNTYFEDEAPVFWLYPNCGKYPFAGGEEVCEGFEDRRVKSAAIKYNLLVTYGLLPGNGVQIPPSTFRLNDLYMDEAATAFTRASYMTNLPAPQPNGVTVAKLYQANGPETFNKYLNQFKAEGFKGAWVRPNNSVWGDLEYFITDEVI